MKPVESQNQTVYCIPGLGASKSIFKHLPEREGINYVLLDQKFPKEGESFEAYIARWSDEIKVDNPILIGVSFGGIIAQELSNLKSVKKIILISSVQTPKAFPWFMKLFKYLRIHKLLMKWVLRKLKRIEDQPKTLKEEKMSYVLKSYLPHREPYYINWSADQIINWNPKSSFDPIIHIHGTKDELFPFGNTKNAIPIKDGTHAMIVTKRKWFEENLLNYLID